MKKLTGVGLGFRAKMADELIARSPEGIDFVEIHPENYVSRGGIFRRRLHAAMERWPVLTHGLTCGFGQTEPVDGEYLTSLTALLQEVNTPWHSEHLCFGGAGDTFVHDLLPLPPRPETLEVAAARFFEMQDRIGRPLSFENVSYYAPMSADPLDEARFCQSLIERGAKIMLDVNNVYVNSQNFGFDPREWINLIDLDAVVQMHVAGHEVREDGLRIDTHGEPVPDPVFELLEYTLRRSGPRAVLLERDNNIPELDTLLAELSRLREVYDRAIAQPRNLEARP